MQEQEKHTIPTVHTLTESAHLLRGKRIAAGAFFCTNRLSLTDTATGFRSRRGSVCEGLGRRGDEQKAESERFHT